MTWTDFAKSLRSSPAAASATFPPARLSGSTPPCPSAAGSPARGTAAATDLSAEIANETEAGIEIEFGGGIESMAGETLASTTTTRTTIAMLIAGPGTEVGATRTAGVGAMPATVACHYYCCWWCYWCYYYWWW